MEYHLMQTVKSTPIHVIKRDRDELVKSRGTVGRPVPQNQTILISLLEYIIYNHSYINIQAKKRKQNSNSRQRKHGKRNPI